MNKLFAIHRIDNNKKEEKLKIFNIKTPKELENNHLTFKLSKNQINISNDKENASSSTFSRKNSLNLLSSEPLSSFNLNTSANSAIKTNETSKFLGKKIKINFEELKENVVNLQNDLIQNISINEKTDSENPANIQNIKYKENKTILNTGRWSTEEHKKFIEGLKVYGKNWKKIQKLIGTRSITQARSHAQKFLMKLKETNFMMNQKINPNLSWTKIMNYLRANFQYNELKDLFFSVEQKEEKKEEKKKIRRIINKPNKNKKKNNSEMSCAGDSNCDTNGESFHILSENDSFNEIDYEKEEKDEKEALEKFIECFNNTSEDINLNSSFEDISIQEDINRYQKDSFDYKTSLKI